jgi:4-oxalocrotonate tautomerase
MRLPVAEERPAMPLVRISLPAARTAEQRRAIADGVHDALVEAFKIPADDRFQIVTEHAPGVEIIRPRSYLGIEYSDELTIIQITANEGRTVDQKKLLYRTIVERLTQRPGLRAEDVVINLVEVRRENWSFGKGEAPYA